MVTGMIYHTKVDGLEGAIFSLTGLGIGIGVMIIFYLLGGTGAGDVKLMGAVGSLLGPRGAFIAFLVTSMVGGIYALLVLAKHGYLRETVKRYGAILKTYFYTRELVDIPTSSDVKKPRLCYGMVIALGTFIVMVFNIRF